MTPATKTATGSYQVEYFVGRPPRATSSMLFKRVGFPGRKRPEVFVLYGSDWLPAAGLFPPLAGTPEWDPAAEPISRKEAESFLKKAGWDAAEVKVAMSSKEGMRRRQRPAS